MGNGVRTRRPALETPNMSTSAYENAAAMLRQQQRTTARLRAGLPALLAQLEHAELLPQDPTAPSTEETQLEGFDPFEPDPAPPLRPVD